ncbi:MAG: hypothetical protein WCV93_04725 [Candidatus Shapirobacteria bacterium]
MLARLSSIIVVIFSVGLIVISYLNFDYSQTFGYMDPQSFWQNTNELVKGKILYRDFFSEYGIFGLIIRAPIHLIFNGTFQSSIINNYLFLPLFSLFISLIIGLIFFSGFRLALFLLFLAIFQTNITYDSFRHLLPELGLVLSLLGLYQNSSKKIILGNSFLAISLISSPEYALISNLVVFIYFLVKSVKKITFFLPQFIIGSLWLVYLVLTKTLANYFSFFIQYVRSFYNNSPSRDTFPRLAEYIGNNRLDIDRLNYYLLPLALLLLVVIIFKHRQIKYKELFVLVIIYSLLACFRTVNTPQYLYYGVTLPILIFIHFLFDPQTKVFHRFILSFILIWFFLTQSNKVYSQYYLNGFQKIISQPNTQTKLLPLIGAPLATDIATGYTEVVDYIKSNTATNDKILVYPNGPYCQLSDRQNAFPYHSNWLFSLTPGLQSYAMEYLQSNSPKLVVINTYNATDILTHLNNRPYAIYSQSGQIIFNNLLTPLKIYIQDNYKIAQKFKLAWVLVKRDKPIVSQNYFKSLGIIENFIYIDAYGLKRFNANKFMVTKNRPIIGLDIDRKKYGDESLLIKIPIKVDLGPIASLSKFKLKVYGLWQGEINNIQTQFVSLSQQNLWIADIKGYENYLTIQVTDNLGFIPFGRPLSIELGNPEIFIKNPKLKLDSQDMNQYPSFTKTIDF